MGLKSSSFWASWFITGFFLSTVATLMQILIGIICNFEFFINTPFMYKCILINRILFIIFFTCSICMIIMAFMLSTIISSQRVGYSISFLFLLVSIILQLFLSEIYIVYMIFYPENMSFWVSFP
jgi:hypothetical protein